MSKAILIFACIFSMCVKPPEYVAVSDKSVEVYAKSILRDGMKILSIGGFYHKSLVEKLYLDLDYQGVLSDEAANKMIGGYVKGLLTHINQDQSLKRFLIKSEFSENDISVSLSFISEQGKQSQVHVYNHKVIFSTYNKETNQLIEDRSIPLSLDP
jgi:hypothetical protein